MWNEVKSPISNTAGDREIGRSMTFTADVNTEIFSPRFPNDVPLAGNRTPSVLGMTISTKVSGRIADVVVIVRDNNPPESVIFPVAVNAFKLSPKAKLDGSEESRVKSVRVSSIRSPASMKILGINRNVIWDCTLACGGMYSSSVSHRAPTS
eukprot:111727-Rhodomonas_salina.1